MGVRPGFNSTPMSSKTIDSADPALAEVRACASLDHDIRQWGCTTPGRSLLIARHIDDRNSPAFNGDISCTCDIFHFDIAQEALRTYHELAIGLAAYGVLSGLVAASGG